jgi:hypothetical protein
MRRVLDLNPFPATFRAIAATAVLGDDALEPIIREPGRKLRRFPNMSNVIGALVMVAFVGAHVAMWIRRRRD